MFFDLATEITRLRRRLSVFLSPEKEKRGKERAARGIPPCPPLCGGDTTTACGISGEDGVQVAQCGQVRVHLLNVLPRTNPARRGRAARLTEQTSLTPNTETFSAVHYISSAAATGRTRSPGGLGGRSRIEFIVSPLPRRRHNESHFAAQSPERAFLAKPFFARAKNGVNLRRRSLKISVGKTKPDSEPSPLRGRWRRSRRMRCSAIARYLA